MARKKYTSALEAISYTGRDPKIMEFGKGGVDYNYIGQSCGGISSDLPMRSDGFTNCSALLIKNSQTLETVLLHLQEPYPIHNQTPFINQLIVNYVKSLKIDMGEKERLFPLISAATRYWSPKNFYDADYSKSLREEFKARMAELNKDKIVKACFVEGDLSLERKYNVGKELLDYLGILTIEEILVNTKDSWWYIACKPKESAILVDSRKLKKVFKFAF